jgi:predicted MFS family arabinose efflux permease
VTDSPLSIWRNEQFRAYVASTSFTGFSFSMQMLLINWLLIGVLHTSADQVGMAHAIIGVPGFFIMLWGGASADRVDPRGLMVRTYAVAALPPLVLAAIHSGGALSYWAVTLTALAMSTAIAYAGPAHAAVLNRVSGSRVQEGVTATTALGFLVQLLGLGLAGQLDRIGIETVLFAQCIALLFGCLMIRRLRRFAPRPSHHESVMSSLLEGFQVVRSDRLLVSLMSLNITSMLFNFGTFSIVFPFIMTQTYGGDAAFLGWMLVLFFFGGAVSNFIMLPFMPLAQPGRLFLGMQLTRALIFVLFWIQPPLWALVLATFLWGLNMGVTTTTSRAIVQESSQAAFRARTLAVFNACSFGVQPFGALLLGWVISAVGPLDAMLPGMLISAGICVVGIAATPVWAYRSPAQSTSEPSSGATH